MQINLPHNFLPREYQIPILAALDGGKKRAVAVWHRRGGKDKTFFNHTIREAFQRVGIYYYFFPTYNQGRKILWDGIDREGFPFLDHIPKELVQAKNATEMKINLLNGSLFQIIGTDNYDAIMGTNPVGCVFSEFSLQDPQAWQFIRPILTENKGWAIFPFTPRGYNHGYELYEMARKNPAWYCERLTVNDTKAISKEEIQAERDAGMPEEMIQQEFYCEFVAVSGQAFRFTTADHMVKDIPIPDWAPIYMAMDWGYGAPFSIGWYWVDSDGRLFRCHEWYGWNGTPNQGLRLTDSEIAAGIIEKEKAWKISDQVKMRILSPDCFQKKPDYKGGGQGPSTAEEFSRVGLQTIHPGDPSRKLKIRQFRQRLAIPGDGGIPMLQIYESCRQFIRTVPLLQVDLADVEDVDTTGEDHCYDEAAIMCMARPITTGPVLEVKPVRPPANASEVATIELKNIWKEVKDQNEAEFPW